jgi:hypothetical protein
VGTWTSIRLCSQTFRSESKHAFHSTIPYMSPTYVGIPGFSDSGGNLVNASLNLSIGAAINPTTVPNSGLSGALGCDLPSVQSRHLPSRVGGSNVPRGNKLLRLSNESAIFLVSSELKTASKEGKSPSSSCLICPRKSPINVSNIPLASSSPTLAFCNSYNRSLTTWCSARSCSAMEIPCVPRWDSNAG